MIWTKRGKHSRSRTPRADNTAQTAKTEVRGRGWSRLGPVAAAAFLLSAMLFSTPGGTALHSVAGAVTPDTSANCPGGVSQCISVSPTGCTSSCPVVVVGPTENVGEGEYVYLSMEDFPASYDVRIALCPVAKVPVIGTNPSCANGLDPDGVTLSPSEVPVSPEGIGGASFPTEVDASGEGNTPLPAIKLISTLPADPNVQSFFCDNGPDYCALFVQDYPPGEATTTLNSSNTAVVPLSFASQTGGCPKSAPLVSTDSAFSVEHFIPAADDSTCTGQSGVTDLDTASNNSQIVQDFQSGGTPIAFTDAPQDPSEVAGLKAGSYKFIPIAVSATVVAFLAGDDPGGPAFPIDSYNLTPNMVAGLIVGNYLGPYASDVIMPPLDCKKIYGCGPGQEDMYDAFDYLNPPPPDVGGPQNYGVFFSSVATGASYQVTDWLCSAPNVPFTVTVPMKVKGKPVPTPVPVLDPNTAQTTLTTPEIGEVWPPVGDPTAQWPYQKCQPYSSLPVLSASVAQYSFAETQDLQAHALRSFAYVSGHPYQTSGGETVAGFGAMDWSEASYYGLNSANLQNADGQFVSPSQASIDAALSDASTLPDGVISYNYGDSTDAAAYPMPLVTYALVSTAAVSPAKSQAEGDLLTNLVCYSHSGGSIALPTGYVPLPSNLYTQARSEISATFPYSESSCNGPTPTLPGKTGTSSGGGHTKGSGDAGGSSTSGSTHSGGNGSTSSGSTSSGSTSSGGSSGSSSKTGSVGTTKTSKGSGSTKPSGTTSGAPKTQGTPSAPPSKGIEPIIVALAEGTERWIVAGLAGAALLGLLVGPLVVLAPRARRRLFRANAAS